MAHGGYRPGAGRPPGALNKRTQDTVAQIEESGLTPLDYLLSVMRDTGKPDNERIDAAKAAAPFVHARLTVTENVPPFIEIPTGPELMQQIKELLTANPELLAEIEAATH